MELRIPLPYNPELFVGREDKIKSVLTIVTAMLAGETPQTRTLVITGQRGSGKTWFLHHLNKNLKDEFDEHVKTVFLDLEQWGTIKDPEQFVREVLAAFAEQLPAQAGRIREEEKATVALRRWTEWLVQDVRQLTRQGNVLVLLLDSVYETDPDLLERLEDVLLAPLAVEKGVLIVLAGRGIPPFWRSPELGLYSKVETLDPFQEAESLQLLAKARITDPQRIQQVLNLSGGYPYLLWQLGRSRPEEDKATLTAALNYMLQPVLKDPQTWQRWKPAAILAVFDEDRLANLAGSDLSEAKTFLNTLLEANLAGYKKNRRGYVLDEAIHQVWEQVVRLSEPETWLALHRQAAELYHNWAAQFERTAETWREEARYHENVLKEATHA